MSKKEDECAGEEFSFELNTDKDMQKNQKKDIEIDRTLDSLLTELELAKNNGHILGIKDAQYFEAYAGIVLAKSNRIIAAANQNIAKWTKWGGIATTLIFLITGAVVVFTYQIADYTKQLCTETEKLANIETAAKIITEQTNEILKNDNMLNHLEKIQTTLVVLEGNDNETLIFTNKEEKKIQQLNTGIDVNKAEYTFNFKNLPSDKIIPLNNLQVSVQIDDIDVAIFSLKDANNINKQISSDIRQSLSITNAKYKKPRIIVNITRINSDGKI